jgi:preprotein translocase subunit SecE
MAPTGLNPGPEVRSRMLRTGGESYLAWTENVRINGSWARWDSKSGCRHRKEDGMNKLVQFIKESYAELRKVVWPSKEDVISSVKVVIVSTVIIAAVLGLVDVLLLFGIRALFKG